MRPRFTYTLWDELNASPDQPMPAEKRLHQLTRMWGGLAALETSSQPTVDDWRVCSDAVNLMETLVEMAEVKDPDELVADCAKALAEAGQRYQRGQGLRLDGAGIRSLRAVLEDYAAALEQLPHRTMVACHRKTERRIYGIVSGRSRPHDVRIVTI